MASELSDQKLFSASRKSVRPPNHPTPTRTARMTSGQIPAIGYSSLVDSLLTQIAATTGATPSTRPGPTISRNHATASFGRLISASRLPASESSERRLELDASSSTSPRRGSITDFKQLLQKPRGGSDVARAAKSNAFGEYAPPGT